MRRKFPSEAQGIYKPYARDTLDRRKLRKKIVSKIKAAVRRQPPLQQFQPCFAYLWSGLLKFKTSRYLEAMSLPASPKAKAMAKTIPPMKIV